MIYIEVLDLKWEPGRFLEYKPLRRVFEDYMAKEFIRLIRLSIKKQRYLSKWPPLSSSYLREKIAKGYSANIWEATGELAKTLSYNPRSRKIGWDNRRVHKGGTKSIVIARSVEFGTMKIPPRPLYRMVYYYMRKNVTYFFNKFVEEI